MQRTIGLFAALLTVQLVAAAALYWYQQQSGHPAPQRPLVAWELSAVDRLAINDGEDELVLQRGDGGWLLPQYRQLPVTSQMIDEALQAIGEVTTRWPVTTTQASHQRFEVSEDNYQRHLRLYDGDTQVGEFFLGTSPAFRQVHLRRAGEEDVYAVDLKVTSLPVGPDAWLDGTLLALADPQRIAGPDYLLQSSSGDTWELEDASEDTAAKLDQERARQLANALANLRVQSLAVDPPAAEAAYSLKVTSGDEVLRYSFFSTDDTHYVQRDDLDAVFTVSQYDYDRITGVTLEQLAP